MLPLNNLNQSPAPSLQCFSTLYSILRPGNKHRWLKLLGQISTPAVYFFICIAHRWLQSFGQTSTPSYSLYTCGIAIHQMYLHLCQVLRLKSYCSLSVKPPMVHFLIYIAKIDDFNLSNKRTPTVYTSGVVPRLYSK